MPRRQYTFHYDPYYWIPPYLLQGSNLSSNSLGRYLRRTQSAVTTSGSNYVVRNATLSTLSSLHIVQSISAACFTIYSPQVIFAMCFQIFFSISTYNSLPPSVQIAWKIHTDFHEPACSDRFVKSIASVLYIDIKWYMVHNKRKNKTVI
jgi:hypothetical protein